MTGTRRRYPGFSWYISPIVKDFATLENCDQNALGICFNASNLSPSTEGQIRLSRRVTRIVADQLWNPGIEELDDRWIFGVNIRQCNIFISEPTLPLPFRSLT